MGGLKAWLVQRVSAVYLAGFLVYFLLYLLLAGPHSYAEWSAWMGSGAMSLATALFFVALLAHAWVGIRDVLLDYIKPFALRLSLLVLLALALLLMGLWVIKVLFMAGGV